jgi:hypothetical protein
MRSQSSASTPERPRRSVSSSSPTAGKVSRRCQAGARLTIDDEVVVYCPECNEREFSDRYA